MKNKTPFRKMLLGIVLFTTLITCSEEPKVTSSRIKVDANSIEGTLTPYYFDWESSDYVPTPPGTNVLVPWASNTNQGFSQEIRYDYKASDGWVMVYNTFSPTQIYNPKSIVLYNKFRGLLRFYLYVDAYNTPAPSDYIVDEVSLEALNGVKSSMLSFAGQDIVDMATNKVMKVSEIIPYRVSATSGWYAFQHEIAYDPSITSRTYQDLNLKWASRSVSVSQIDLSGNINGSIKSPVSEKPGFNFLSAVKGVVSLTGLAVLDANPNWLGKNVTNAVISGLNSGFQGGVRNVFNAVFGGNSNNAQSVDLKLNAQIGLTGNEVSNSGLMDDVLVIPGVSNSQSTPGFAPLYNSPLGVFNITSTPTIKYTITCITDPHNGIACPNSEYRRYSLSIVSNSFTVQFNPAVTAIATITNLSKEIIGISPDTKYDQSNGDLESVGDYPNIKAGMTYFMDYDGYQIHKEDFLVRISFDVVPNNGAPKSTIIKTFNVNLVKGTCPICL